MPWSPSGPRVLRTPTACAASTAAALMTGCALNPFAVPQDSVHGLDVGACLDGTAEEVSDAAPTDCDRPHHGEIYARVAMDDGEYPGEDELRDTAVAECGGEFEKYVGTAHLQSELELATAVPSKRMWTLLNDRNITCIAVDPTGETTGSVAGTQR